MSLSDHEGYCRYASNSAFAQLRQFAKIFANDNSDPARSLS